MKVTAELAYTVEIERCQAKVEGRDDVLYRTGAMQDSGYELPRKSIPRTPVNKGMKREEDNASSPMNRTTRLSIESLVRS